MKTICKAFTFMFVLMLLLPTISSAEKSLIGCRNFEYMEKNGQQMIQATCPKDHKGGAEEVVKTANFTGKVGVEDGNLEWMSGNRSYFPDKCKDIRVFLQREHEVSLAATCELEEKKYPFKRYTTMRIDYALVVLYGW